MQIHLSSSSSPTCVERGEFLHLVESGVESHDCSSTTEKDESRSGRHGFLSTNFQSDIPVEDSRKGRRDQVRLEHAELHGLSPHHQSAYRPFHSTETADLAVHNSIVETIDSGKLCALVLLELSAAFDTVDHPIMLQVLHDGFSVKDKALKWFESYLSDRTQTYQVKDQQSRLRTVYCSVPQGSVLGPQKFNAYTEDLANLIDDHLLDHHMYADDTQLVEYTTASNIPNAIMKLQLHHTDNLKFAR